MFSADAINSVDRCGRQKMSALVILIPNAYTLAVRKIISTLCKNVLIVLEPPCHPPASYRSLYQWHVCIMVDLSGLIDALAQDDIDQRVVADHLVLLLKVK